MFETNVGDMTCPSIFTFRVSLSLSAIQAPAPRLISLTSPMRQSSCDSASSPSLAVSWIEASPPVAVRCSQYLVLGCNATSSGVVNVMSW